MEEIKVEQRGKHERVLDRDTYSMNEWEDLKLTGVADGCIWIKTNSRGELLKASSMNTPNSTLWANPADPNSREQWCRFDVEPGWSKMLGIVAGDYKLKAGHRGDAVPMGDGTGEGANGTLSVKSG